MTNGACRQTTIDNRRVLVFDLVNVKGLPQQWHIDFLTVPDHVGSEATGDLAPLREPPRLVLIRFRRIRDRFELEAGGRGLPTCGTAATCVKRLQRERVELVEDPVAWSFRVPLQNPLRARCGAIRCSAASTRIVRRLVITCQSAENLSENPAVETRDVH